MHSFGTALRDDKSSGKQLKGIKVIDWYCKGVIGIVSQNPFGPKEKSDENQVQDRKVILYFSHFERNLATSIQKAKLYRF